MHYILPTALDILKERRAFITSHLYSYLDSRKKLSLKSSLNKCHAKIQAKPLFPSFLPSLTTPSHLFYYLSPGLFNRVLQLQPQRETDRRAEGDRCYLPSVPAVPECVCVCVCVVSQCICTVCSICVCTYWLKAVHLSLEPGLAEQPCCVHSRSAFFQQSPFILSAIRLSMTETYMQSLA